MIRFQMLWRAASLALLAIGVGVAAEKVAEPDPKVMSFELPDKIPWVDHGGSAQAVLAGDPNKPGLYVYLVKWKAHNMSRPHFHPNDRFIYVLKGTWYVGWGPKYTPESTYPMPAGSFVTHFGKQIHYDGAKDEDTILEIVGIGPANSTNAEQK
jgi:hypothetical protein